MYKYMCVVSDSADKQVYYDTVAELKKRYPDCCEDTTARFGKGTMGQVLNIPESSVIPKKVCVMIDEEKSQVVVLSETYLCSFFNGRTVEAARKRKRPIKCFSRGIGILLDIMFFVINFIAGVIAFDVVDYDVFDYIGCIGCIGVSVVFAVIHTILSIFIQRKYDVSGARLFLMQIGGWGTPVIIVIALFYLLAIARDWDAVAIIICFICYASVIIPTLILSSIARFIYNRIKSN